MDGWRNVSAIKWDYEDPPQYESFWFEHFDADDWKRYAQYYWKLPFYVSAVYLFLIFSLQAYMKNREPFNLRAPLAIWNLTLAIFSVFGFYRTAPEFFNVLLGPDGFYRSICTRVGLNQPSAFWCLMFALSKYIELGDTLFIVLRKQPLLFLQWFHHCTAMILPWVIIPATEPICRWFGVINYFVHSIMYPYFFAKSIRIKVPRKFSMIMTTVQLSQMIIAGVVNFYSLYILATGGNCARDSMSIKWIGVAYGAFAILFAHFFYNAYFNQPKKIKEP